jgi:predicted aspartyl protease
MPAYDDSRFSPPAPVVHSTVHCPRTGETQADIPMLIDSGADVILPKAVVDSLSLERSDTKYQLLAFDGELSVSEAVHGELLFLGRIFKGQFLIVDQAVGIVGRDVLNHVSLLLDGPNLQWEEQNPRYPNYQT